MYLLCRVIHMYKHLHYVYNKYTILILVNNNIFMTQVEKYNQIANAFKIHGGNERV